MREFTHFVFDQEKCCCPGIYKKAINIFFLAKITYIFRSGITPSPKASHLFRLSSDRWMKVISTTTLNNNIQLWINDLNHSCTLISFPVPPKVQANKCTNTLSTSKSQIKRNDEKPTQSESYFKEIYFSKRAFHDNLHLYLLITMTNTRFFSVEILYDRSHANRS